MSLSHDHAAEVNAGIIDNLKAENARLHAEVERQRRRCKNTALAWAHAGEMQDEAVRYKALAEQCGEVLERARWGLGEALAFYRIALRRGAHWCSNESEQMDATKSALESVDAAIAAKPEELT